MYYITYYVISLVYTYNIWYTLSTIPYIQPPTHYLPYKPQNIQNTKYDAQFDQPNLTTTSHHYHHPTTNNPYTTTLLPTHCYYQPNPTTTHAIPVDPIIASARIFRRRTLNSFVSFVRFVRSAFVIFAHFVIVQSSFVLLFFIFLLGCVHTSYFIIYLICYIWCCMFRYVRLKIW